MSTSHTCLKCQQPPGEGLFCQFCGVFILDPDGSVVMASRGERLLGWLVNVAIIIVTLFVGWVIWWFIVAPRGQNPGKAIVGTRVIRTDGSAVRTGGMFVRGLAELLASLIPLYLDYLWILWDKDAQTIHDKLVNTVVVKAQGSEKIVESGLGSPPVGAAPPAPYAPPVSLPSSPSAPVSKAGSTAEDALTRLADLRAKDLITEEEYQEKRRSILREL